MAVSEQQRPIDEDKLNAFVFKAVEELGATLNAALVVMGDRLGLYKQMAADGPVTPSDLADRTSTAEPYIREWLNAQAAGGFVDYDPATRTYSLQPEQAMALADESSPAFLPGAFQIATGVVRDAPKIEAAARSGAGIGWHEHDHDVFHGCERFFRPGYNANLVSTWLPALEGVVGKLQTGARVADIGCGHGASTILMAESFPASTFTGFDYHDESIQTARQRADEAGIADRVGFETAPAVGVPRRAVRPRHDVRLPARHGRPGRRRPPRVPLARPGRHVDGRRAPRRRQRRGQPEPGRARVLRVLDAALHPRLPVPGGRPGARHAGR